MKKIVARILIILIIIGCVSFIMIEGLILIEGSKVATNSVDYVIILGARLYGDTPSPALLERLKIAKDYLIKNKDVKVVVSGGQGEDEYIPEAQAMANYLIDKGIDEERIIIEDKSTSTFENLQYSLDNIRELNDKEDLEVLLVTNKYHIFRTKFLAKRLGMIPYGLPAKILPTIINQSYIREYFAVIKSFIFDRQ
jgi:uncharacterized SAM-binding protein YcdF (DUF218 family)